MPRSLQIWPTCSVIKRIPYHNDLSKEAVLCSCCTLSQPSAAGEKAVDAVEKGIIREGGVGGRGGGTCDGPEGSDGSLRGGLS